MQVEVISATEKPVDVISLAAGCCYGKSDVSEKRVRHCFENGHMSVFEHAVATFKIEGISRACMAQLTRHRVASFCVQSQRYCRIDTASDGWYVMPDAFKDNGTLEKCFRQSVLYNACEYQSALESGVKPEDARYLLPEATKTNLVMTCNLRELFHIFDMRLAKAAQQEIRELAGRMLREVGAINGQWDYLMELYGGAE